MSAVRVRRLLVAGGAGFLGAAFIRDRLKADPEIMITALDLMHRPGAGGDLEDLVRDGRLELIRGDVADRVVVGELTARADAIVNFASQEFGADTDGSALAAADVRGTVTLLEAIKKAHIQRFVLVSSAAVYGPPKGMASREDDPVAPRTTAAAARAAAEMFVRAYHVTHGVPVVIARGVAAYGPRQPVEQPVARLIISALEGRTLSVDGDGSAVRDYLFVDDQVSAIARVLWKGEVGTAYNIGGGSPIADKELAETILRLCNKPTSLKQFAKHRPSWSSLIESKRIRPLGWEPRTAFGDGLRATVEWYRKNEAWWRPAQAA